MTVRRPTANFLLVFCVLLASFRLSQSQTPSAESSHTSFAIARGTRTVLSSSLLPISSSFDEEQESFWELPEGFGQFEITQYPNIPYKFFTLEQLINGSVSYQHNYTAGLAPVQINVTMTTNNERRVYYIHALPFEGNISLATNSCLPLVENTNKVLSSNNLLATTNFSNQNPVLSYMILSPLAHGYLEVYEPMSNPSNWHWVKSSQRSRRPANSNFTQSEINRGHVRYVSTAAVPDGTGMLLDSFQFRIFSNQLPGPEGSFCIRVLSLVKPSLVIVAANVSAAEGREVTVTRNRFSVSLSLPLLDDLQRWWDEPFAVDQLVIEVIITSQPQHGQLILSGNPLSGEVVVPLRLFENNSVVYAHDGSENFLDSISFRLRATSVGSLPLILPDQTELTTLWINVQPINDNTPVLIQSGPITLTEGSFVIINSSMLHVEDPDQNTSPADISIELLPNQTDPNSRFATVEMIDQAIDRFRYSDILQNRIIFYSAISTEGQLEFARGVRVTDGLHSYETVVNISITPITISATASPQECHTTLDTLSNSLSLSLPVSAFNLSISSRQLIHQVLVYITTSPAHGEIIDHSSRSTSPLDKFMYVDMEENRIHYSLSDRLTRMNVDTFNVMFKLGHGTSNPVTFRVCILPLPHPYLVHNKPINIKEGTEIVLSNETLRANQTRPAHGNPADIRYYIKQSPIHGSLVNNTRDDRPLVTTFTQADIDDEIIGFVSPTIENHINSDNFSFTLANEYYNITEAVYSIEVAYEITDVKTIHEFTVREGEHHIITTDEFFVAVPPGYTEFDIFIPVQPRHGNLILTYPNYTARNHPSTIKMEEVRNGYFSYNLDLSEETNIDSFLFLVVTRRPNHPAETLKYTCTINVILVNDNAPEEILNVAPQVYNQGQVAITSADNLKLNDADFGYNSNNLKYVLQDPYRHGPTQGYLYFANDSTTKIDTWYQGDMNGALHYRHDGRIPQSTFDFMNINVSDGLHVVSILFHISVKEVQFTRTRISPISVNEGSSSGITNLNLEYSVNIDGTKAVDYEYTVTIPPSHGKIEILPRFDFTQPLPLLPPIPHETSSFTQRDLKDGSLFYVHDGSETTMDSFTFSVTVKGYTKQQDYVSIRITPVDDQPPRLLANEPLFVLADYRYASFNESILQMADNDTARNDQLEYVVTSPPRYGKLHRRRAPSSDLPLLSDVDQWNQTNRFSQQDIENTLIWYRHTNLSTWIDSFEFQITDGSNRVTETFVKQIIILPDRLSVAMTPVRVVEGDEVVLPRDSFSAIHPYFADKHFTVHILSSPNGKLRYVNNNRVTTTFTSVDLANSRIKYTHGGDENPVATFTFYLDFGLRRSASVRYSINVQSVNDHAPLLRTTKTLVLWAKQVVTVNQTYLYTTDRDAPPSMLRYIFTFEPGQATDGHFALRSSQNVPNTNFTQEEVNSGDIVFVDLHTYDGIRNISFTVSDGLYIVNGFFVVDAKVLKLHRPYPGVRMEVGIGMAANLTEKALHFQTNAVSPSTPPSQILFNLKPGSPKYGSLYRTGDRSEPITSFTQEDVDQERVEYVHEAVDVWEAQDQLKFVVSTHLADSVHDTENISIQLPPILADPLATVGTLAVKENNVSCLDPSILDARNFRYIVWNRSKTQLPLASVRLAYRVFSPPSLGHILARGEEVQGFNQDDMMEGVVCYKHRNGTESERDEFTLEVMVVSNDGQGEVTVLNSTMATITVNIMLYNDEKPLLLTSSAPQKNVIVNYPSLITKDDLEVQDMDNSPSEIFFTVLSFDGNNGLRLLGDDPTTGITRFTQSDINDGRLYFNASSSITSQFNFSFTDGLYESDVYTFSLSAVDHAWTVVEQDIFILQTNPSIILSTDTIKVTTNAYLEETLYYINKAPSHGRVNVSGAAASGFTQSDLISDLVMYELTDYSVYNDSFTIEVTNRRLSRIVEVRVTIEADDSGTKQNKLLEADMCQVLPPDMIDLSSLSLRRKKILLQLVEDLKFGELRVFYDQPHRTKRDTYYSYDKNAGRSKRNAVKREFRYDDYKSGFVYYMWKQMPNVNPNDTYMETLSVKVVVDGLPPGFLSVNFTVVAPPGATKIPTTSVTVSSTPPSGSTTTSSTGTDQSAYSIVNLLVPTVGIVVLILIVTVVIFVFCLAHSGKIMTSLKSKKAGSILSFPAHRGLSPYRAQSHSTLRSPHLRGRIEDDAMRDDETNSDISSAASIVVLPTFQSHHQVPPTFLRQSSQGYISGSNYSHTLSYADSPIYDEDDENSTRTTPFPLQRILESPVPRSALHSPTRLDNSTYTFNRGSHARATSPARGRGFSAGRASGRLSPSKSTSMREVSYNPQFRLVRTFSRESSTTMDYESESSCPRDTPRLQHSTSPGLAVTNKPSSTSAPAANDNQTLYRTTNPVLKDTEYWV